MHDVEEDVENYELFDLYGPIIHSVRVTLKMIDSKYPYNSVRKSRGLPMTDASLTHFPSSTRHAIDHKTVSFDP